MATLPVIGRSDDLVRVDAALDRAAHEQPGLVLMVGEAGVGKTTLLTATRERAVDLDFIVATGGCALETVGTGFSPFRAAFRQLATSRPAELTAALSANVVVGALLPASLRTAPSASGSPDPDELYDGVLGLLGDLGQTAPVFLALEDLHWADRSTLELVSYLVHNLSGERVLLAATARREDLEPGAAPTTTVAELGRQQTTERIDLYGLDLTAMGDLVEATGRTLDAGAVRALHHRTGGNPFYALELLDAGSTDIGSIPPSVRDTLTIRFDRLRRDHAEIVRAASVIDEIDAGFLAAIVPTSVETAETALRRGTDAGLFVTDPNSGVVAFRHALVREVAYSTLLASERRRLHEAVATGLEHQPDTDRALIAHHYVAAGRTADALRTSIVAARDATRSYAAPEAIGHFQRAVELWDRVDPDQRPTDVDLETLLRDATTAALDAAAPEGVEFGRRLLALEGRADPDARAVDAAHIAEVLWEHHHEQEAEEALAHATELLDGRASSPALVRVQQRQAFQLLMRGQREAGRDLAREALQVARELGDTDGEVMALIRVALAEAALGAVDGMTLLQEAFDAAWATGSAHETGRAAVNWVLLLHTSGRLDGAIEAGRRALAAADDLRMGPSMRAVLAALLARPLIDVGDWDAAEELLGDLRLPNAPRYRAYITLVTAELATARGDRQLAQWALDDSRGFGLIIVLALRRACVEAELALDHDEPHVTREVADAHLPLAMFVADSSHARLSYFALRALRPGDQAAADEYLAGAEARAEVVTALPIGTPLDLPAWMAAVRGAHARVVGESAVDHWARAIDLFTTSGQVVRAGWARAHHAIDLVDERRAVDIATLELSETYGFATRLGAVPLRRMIEDVVRRGRLDVAGVERQAHGDLGLSEREGQVLALVAAGLTNRQIGQELFISPKTASVHVSNILRKIGATTRGEAAAIAHRTGIAPDAAVR